jgi:hypothetical protein
MPNMLMNMPMPRAVVPGMGRKDPPTIDHGPAPLSAVISELALLQIRIFGRGLLLFFVAKCKTLVIYYIF